MLNAMTEEQVFEFTQKERLANNGKAILIVMIGDTEVGIGVAISMLCPAVALERLDMGAATAIGKGIRVAVLVKPEDNPERVGLMIRTAFNAYRQWWNQHLGRLPTPPPEVGPSFDLPPR